jgi:tRNA (guanine-N7-)-methyltransferase
MRLRKIGYAKDLIQKHSNLVFTEPETYKGTWHQVFKNDNPIYIEIGCGKGQFIIDLAQKYQNINFIGIEKFDSVVIRGLEKLLVTTLTNVRFIQHDAIHIENFFEPNEVSQIYLNFSDPWPKRRQAKRRLTHPIFISKYKVILKDSKSIHFKTDNFGLFEYSMMMFNDDPQILINAISLDYHTEKDNIPTEFELKFVSEGKSIFYIHASLIGEK